MLSYSNISVIPVTSLAPSLIIIRLVKSLVGEMILPGTQKHLPVLFQGVVDRVTGPTALCRFNHYRP